MPDLLALVSGTGTEIGKTWTAARIVGVLRSLDVAVAVRKPVQSYEEGTPEEATDAGVLAAASGEDPERVCPRQRWLPRPLAPPIAARLLGVVPPSLSDLAGELALPARGIALVEGVGGPRSPLAADGDTVSLAHRIGAQVVVIVAHAELGAINDVLLTCDAFRPLPTVVFLNRYDGRSEVAATNLEWLRDRERLDVETDVETLARSLVERSPGGREDVKVPPS